MKNAYAAKLASKAKVDERLKVICGDKFQPWEERYG